MQRREATRLIMTGALATPALIRPQTALARIEERSEVEKTRLLRLSLQDRTFTPAFIALLVVSITVAFPLTFWAQTVRSRVNWAKSNQADVTGIPFLGQLFTEPPQKVLERSFLIGLYYIVGSMILLRVVSELTRVRDFEVPENVSFLNRDDHFWTDFTAQQTALPEGLEAYDFERATPIGKGYYDRKTRTVTGVIDPVVGFLTPKS